MKWVIQTNLLNERGYDAFLEALQRLEIDYDVVKVAPFSRKLLPEDFDYRETDPELAEEPYIDPEQKIVAFGTISLGKIAQNKGWSPGIFKNENFEFEVWRDGFGEDNILNAESIVGTIKDISIPDDWNWVFVRPTHDDKAFTGMVRSKYDFRDWQQQISTIEPGEFTPLHKDTVIAVAQEKKIYAEYRLFFVRKPYGFECVTGSQYKLGNDVTHDENVPREVEYFASGMANSWAPTDAFVMDIATTPDGPKIIEINTINSAGFYAADPQKIVMAIEDLGKYS
jgi:hypothetical protein